MQNGKGETPIQAAFVVVALTACVFILMLV
jgi:hypothetical protein